MTIFFQLLQDGSQGLRRVIGSEDQLKVLTLEGRVFGGGWSPETMGFHGVAMKVGVHGWFFRSQLDDILTGFANFMVTIWGSHWWPRETLKGNPGGLPLWDIYGKSIAWQWSKSPSVILVEFGGIGIRAGNLGCATHWSGLNLSNISRRKLQTKSRPYVSGWWYIHLHTRPHTHMYIYICAFDKAPWIILTT